MLRSLIAAAIAGAMVLPMAIEADAKSRGSSSRSYSKSSYSTSRSWHKPAKKRKSIYGGAITSTGTHIAKKKSHAPDCDLDDMLEGDTEDCGDWVAKDDEDEQRHRGGDVDLWPFW